jgi:iron complex outermembrane receptor protein
VTNLQSVMWPDTTLAQGGLFVEGERLLDSEARLRFAGRIDRFTATAAMADVEPMGMNRSPNELYDFYYGSRADDWSDTDASALIRYERRLRSRLTLFSGLSRSIRPADATERYLGSDNPSAPKRWVGNPWLQPSKHHQLDLGVAATGPRSYWALTGFVDQVDDFILRDRAHGQEGIRLSDNASIYRNTEARLIGFELEGRRSLGPRLELDGTAGWVRGDNRTDDRPLAQIPPLQGRLGLRYVDDRWTGAVGLRWATRQTRFDDDPLTGSGLDFGGTSGYAVLDLSGSLEITTDLSVVAGADNLLDHTYADHRATCRARRRAPSPPRGSLRSDADCSGSDRRPDLHKARRRLFGLWRADPLVDDLRHPSAAGSDLQPVRGKRTGQDCPILQSV